MKLKPLSRDQLNQLIQKMPFNRELGLRVARVYGDGLTMELDIREELKNALGTLHGGVTATLVDAAVGVAVFGRLGGLRPTTTVDLKVSYLRPAHGGKVRARARFVKFGKTLVVGLCDVKDEHGHLIATALVTYMLF